MNKILTIRLSLKLTDNMGKRYDNPSNLRLANARHGISREIYISSDKSLYDLHLLIQKLFGWKDFSTHCFELCNEDFLKLTRGNPDIYKDLTGILFRPDCSRSFDWCWHDFKDDEELYKCSILMEGSFFNAKRMGMDSSVNQDLFPQDIKPKPFNKELNPKSNCLIERITVGEIFKPFKKPDYKSLSPGEVSMWTKKIHENALFCVKRLMDLRKNYETDFYGEYDALRELDGWKKSYALLKRIHENPVAVQSRFGLSYEEAKKRHRDMFFSCFEQSKNILINYNPRLEPFLSELDYSYDSGEDWHINLRCTNAFELGEMKDLGYQKSYRSKSATPSLVPEDERAELYPRSLPDELNAKNLVAEPSAKNWGYDRKLSPSNKTPSDLNDDMPHESKLFRPKEKSKNPDQEVSCWIDFSGRPASSKTLEFLEKVNNSHSPICSRSDGVFLMDDIGGVPGFFDFLRTLKGRDKEASRKVREQAASYGWSETKDPRDIKL